MSDISLEEAVCIIDGALAEARRASTAPLSVAVLDRGGHLVALKREDNSGNLRADIAIGKARGSLGMGQSSRAMADRVAHAPHFFAAIAALSGGNVIPAAGGLLIAGKDGKTIGAVGISGDTPDNDEKCALAGIAVLQKRREG
jgi:uncharacterized protein GlcG (DUF336 family)